MKEKYGDERRSHMINHELGKFSDEELIPEEESVILLTNENYIKRTLVVTTASKIAVARVSAV